MLDDKDLLAKFEKDRRGAESQLDKQHKEARDSHIFVAGDTMYYAATVEDKGARREVVFNKVKPYVDAVVGTMIQLRRKPDYYARIRDNMKMRELSNYFNNISDYARTNANLEFVETAQDREMLVTGYGAVDTGISYERNPDGEVVAECIRFDDVFWDPLAKESNLLDARYVFRRKPFSKDEVEVLFKDTPLEEFDPYKGFQGGTQYNPDGGEYDKIQEGGPVENDMVQVVYYQWWELQPYFRAENPAKSIEDPQVQMEFMQLLDTLEETRFENSSPEEQEDLFTFEPESEFLSMTPTQKSDVEALCKEFGLELKAIKQTRRCYYTALITGKTVLRKFKSPHQNGFTIKFKTGNYDPTGRMWYGMVRSLKRPAEFANKALTEILYTIASNSKGGVMYEEDAVEEPLRFEQQWATTKAAIRVKDGALSGGKIQAKAQAALPTGYEMVYQAADAAMTDVAGVSKEFLGTSTNKAVAALLESQRINQVLATLACYFDAVSLYQIEHARLMVTFIRILAQNSQGRLIRIIGQDGAAAYEELSESRMAEEYDIDIGEAPTTPAQKQQTTEIMVGFADKLAALGTNIYAQIIPYLPIKQADQQKLMEAMQPSEEQIASEQEDKAIQRGLNKVIAEGTLAKAKRDLADAQLKKAAVQRTVAEVDETYANTAKLLHEAGQSGREGAPTRSLPDAAAGVM